MVFFFFFLMFGCTVGMENPPNFVIFSSLLEIFCSYFLALSPYRKIKLPDNKLKVDIHFIQEKATPQGNVENQINRSNKY